MRRILFPALLLLALLLTACGQMAEAATASAPVVDKGISWTAMEPTGAMELDYADQFSVAYYGDYALISIVGDPERYLLIPEGAEIPADLEADIVPLCQPLTNLYLVASGAMDMFLRADALDSVRFVGLQPEDWHLPGVREAMEAEELIYAGKYSAPDYERICAEGCSLAIENTMIYHSPEVREELERLGIPVLVEHSSYEAAPQGRMEWAKLYGLLTGHLEEAAAAYDDQAARFAALADAGPTGQSVAFFYVNTNGAAVVRKASDYVPAMIVLAGGSYCFPELGAGEASRSSSATIQMEEFYLAAKDADFIIYNTNIDGELETLDDFLALNELFTNLKAVRDGHVYCTGANLYQASMALGDVVSDLHHMLLGEDGELTYLFKLE